MKKRTRFYTVVALSTLAISATCLAGGLMSKSNITAVAENKEFYVRGAAVRLITDNTVESGIRFSVLMKDSKYQELTENNTTMGVYLIPEDLLFDVNNDGWSAADFASAEHQVVYDSTNSISRWFDSEVDGYMETLVYIYDFPAKSYNRPISAVAYAGDEYTQVISRSFSGVAYEAVQAGEVTETQAGAYLSQNYTISFFDEDGETELVDSQALTYGKTLVVPENVAKDNKKFIGWQKRIGTKDGEKVWAEELYDFSATKATFVQGNMQFRAVWMTATESVNFETEDQILNVKPAYGGTLEIVDFATELASGRINAVKTGYTVPTNLGNGLLKLSGASDDHKGITIDFGKTIAKGTTIKFDFLCYNPKTSDNAWFYVTDSNTNANQYYWSNSSPWAQYWATYYVTLTSDAQTLTLKALFGTGNQDGTITNNDNLVFYFDNINVVKETNAIDFENDTWSNYVYPTATGAVSVVTREAEGAKLNVVKANCQTPNTLGDKVLKVESTTSGDRWLLSLGFGKTLPVGSVVKFDVLCYNPNTANNASFNIALYNNANTGTALGSDTYWANASPWAQYWKTYSFTVSSAASLLRIKAPSAINGTITDSSKLVFYFDNFEVVQPTQTIDFESNGWENNAYVVQDGIVEVVDVETEYNAGRITVVKSGKEDYAANGKLGGKVLKLSGGKSIMFNFGETLAAGTTITFDYLCYNPNTSDSCWFDIKDRNTNTLQKYWSNDSPWSQYWCTYTVTLSTAASTLRIDSVANKDGSATITDQNALVFYFDNVKVTKA